MRGKGFAKHGGRFEPSVFTLGCGQTGAKLGREPFRPSLYILALTPRPSAMRTPREHRERTMWPVNPSWITLRVCADLGWTVTVWCPRCRTGTTLHGKKLGDGKLAATPLHDLFAQGAFKCRKAERGCDGVPASSLEVDCIDVGMSKTVAKWEK